MTERKKDGLEAAYEDALERENEAILATMGWLLGCKPRRPAIEAAAKQTRNEDLPACSMASQHCS